MNATDGVTTFARLLVYQVPFCSPFACTNSDNATAANDGNVVLWDCLPTVCRRRIEGFVALLLILTILTTVFNAVVLAANSLPSTRRLVRRNPTMENYAIYVMSMALADLLVGAVVLPTVLGFFYMELKVARSTAPMNTNTSATEVLTSPVDDSRKSPRTGGVSYNVGSANYLLSSRGNMETMMNSVGVVAHLAIFVSMYTLAAASADRFYTSTKPVSNRSIILSGSFRRKSRFSSSDGDSSNCINLKRSTCAVVVIWACGVLFSMIPLVLFSQFQYRSIGHVYVALVSTGSDDTRMLYWYLIALALPLLITWLFSFLICVTLWRRKRRLKRSYSSKGNSISRGSSRKGNRREQFQRQTSHMSVTESHVTPSAFDRMLSNESDAVVPDSAKDPDSSEDVFDDVKTPPSTLFVKKAVLRHSTPAGRPRIRRPSSIDLGLIKQLAQKEEECGHKRAYSQPTGDTQLPFTKLDDSFVAKRLLCRRSWGGCPEEGITKSSIDVSNRLPQSPTTPISPSPSFQASPGTQASTPNLSVKNLDRRTEGPRNPRTPTRLRRKSSVFRARELLRSKSLESNIVKTLLAVVVAISVAVIPLLVVIAKIAYEGASNISQTNNYISAIVIAMTLLFSNSLWNCLIYGARMPYFRRSIVRMFHKSLRRIKATYCCRQLKTARRTLRRKFRSTSSACQYRPNDVLQQHRNRSEFASDVFSVAKSPSGSGENNGNYVMKPR